MLTPQQAVMAAFFATEIAVGAIIYGLIRDYREEKELLKNAQNSASAG